MSKPIISAKNIKKSFRAKRTRCAASAWMSRRAKCWRIMGPSGSGKSTLLHSLAAITKVDGGEIDFDGQRMIRWVTISAVC